MGDQLGIRAYLQEGVSDAIKIQSFRNHSRHSLECPSWIIIDCKAIEQLYHQFGQYKESVGWPWNHHDEVILYCQNPGGIYLLADMDCIKENSYSRPEELFSPGCNMVSTQMMYDCGM